MRGDGLEIKEVGAKYESHVTKPAASPELGLQGFEAMRNARKSMTSICSFHDVDFQAFLGKQEIGHVKSLLDSVNAALGDPLYQIRGSCKGHQFSLQYPDS